jgi:hypothetical protein
MAIPASVALLFKVHCAHVLEIIQNDRQPLRLNHVNCYRNKPWLNSLAGGIIGSGFNSSPNHAILDDQKLLRHR